MARGNNFYKKELFLSFKTFVWIWKAEDAFFLIILLLNYESNQLIEFCKNS